jgi:hypothetical protein
LKLITGPVVLNEFGSTFFFTRPRNHPVVNLPSPVEHLFRSDDFPDLLSLNILLIKIYKIRFAPEMNRIVKGGVTPLCHSAERSKL